MATEDQPFMVVGINLPTLGCWKITARYQDAQVSYVVWGHAVDGRGGGQRILRHSDVETTRQQYIVLKRGQVQEKAMKRFSHALKGWKVSGHDVRKNGGTHG